MKIKSVEINGLRGIRGSIDLPLKNQNSTLIYGDNGSGKSSITDAFEWFYYDQVEHLAGEEIGQRGIKGLRNLFIPDSEMAYIDLQFSKDKVNSRKQLTIKRSKLVSEHTNGSEEFYEYIKASNAENLILRYRDLLKFILFTKSEKLKEISQIIGFSELSNIKSIFKSAANSLKKESRIKNFDGQINNKQALILDQIGRNIHTDEQFLDAINELIKPLNLDIEAKDTSTVEKILESIKKPEDEGAIRIQLSYERVIESLGGIENLVNEIESNYTKFYENYQKIVEDIDKFKKINLEKLLSEGLAVLQGNIMEEDKCPLCLQYKSRDELIDDLRQRVEKLSVFKKEQANLEEARKNTQDVLQAALSTITSSLSEECLNRQDNVNLKEKIVQIKDKLSGSFEKLRVFSLSDRKELKKAEDILSPKSLKIIEIITELKEKKEKILGDKKDDLKFTIHSKIVLVKQSYSEINSLKDESEILKKQLQSLERIYNQFSIRQSNALSSFLKAISKDLNDFYLFMNDAEKVDEIELIPLEEDDDLLGLTIQFKFHGKVVSPPNKYLSESHLNCLGISLFLASVKTFNKRNKFFILDDVISSFDKGHRLRFANLLMEKFADYQIFLFTHEKDWFEYLAHSLRGKNWHITKVTGDLVNGARLDVPLIDLKEKIELKFSKSETDDLGNFVRRYLERLLKEICLNTEVKMRFLYNDQNENRMCNELFSELRSKLKARKCEIKDHQVFNRLNASVFIGNVTSHDSPFSEDIADLKAFYDDVLDLEKLFVCDDCKKTVSQKNYDNINKVIRCQCGNKQHEWKL